MHCDTPRHSAYLIVKPFPSTLKSQHQRLELYALHAFVKSLTNMQHDTGISAVTGQPAHQDKGRPPSPSATTLLRSSFHNTVSADRGRHLRSHTMCSWSPAHGLCDISTRHGRERTSFGQASPTHANKPRQPKQLISDAAIRACRTLGTPQLSQAPGASPAA